MFARSSPTADWLPNASSSRTMGRSRSRAFAPSQRHGGPAAQARAAALRDQAAGVHSVGRRPPRHWRADRGGRVVGVGRLPSLLAIRTSGAPHRPGRDRGLLGPSTSRRVPVPPGTPDAALGALRGSQELLAPPQPRSRLLRAVKARHDGKFAAMSVARKLARRCDHVLRSVDPELVYAIPA